jgi:hypothetical protein
VALGQVFSEYFGFPCQVSFHRLLHNHHLSSGAGTRGQLVADVPSGLGLTPHPKLIISIRFVLRNTRENIGYLHLCVHCLPILKIPSCELTVRSRSCAGASAVYSRCHGDADPLSPPGVSEYVDVCFSDLPSRMRRVELKLHHQVASKIRSN